MNTLTIGAPLRPRVGIALIGGALLLPALVTYIGLAIARFFPNHVHVVVGIGVAAGILAGAACVGRVVRVRVAALVVVLLYLAVAVPLGFYVIAWSRCAALGDCL